MNSKLQKNLAENMTARQIGVAGFALLRMLVPVLAFFGFVLLVQATTGHGAVALAAAPALMRPVSAEVMQQLSMAEAKRKGVNLVDPRRLRQMSRLGAGRHAGYTPMLPNPQVNGVQEFIDWYLYDQMTVAVNTAFPNKTTLFQTPVGGTSKTLANTNIQAAGRLPGGQRFTCATVQVYVFNNATLVDLQAAIANLSIQVFFNNKVYAQGTLNLYPAGCGGIVTAAAELGTVAAGDASLQSTSNGIPDPRAVFVFNPPVDIDTDQNISAVITAESAFTTQANTTRPPGTGLTLSVILAGKLFRPVV